MFGFIYSNQYNKLNRHIHLTLKPFTCRLCVDGAVGEFTESYIQDEGGAAIFGGEVRVKFKYLITLIKTDTIFTYIDIDII